MMKTRQVQKLICEYTSSIVDKSTSICFVKFEVIYYIVLNKACVVLHCFKIN